MSHRKWWLTFDVDASRGRQELSPRLKVTCPRFKTAMPAKMDDEINATAKTRVTAASNGKLVIKPILTICQEPTPISNLLPRRFFGKGSKKIQALFSLTQPDVSKSGLDFWRG